LLDAGGAQFWAAHPAAWGLASVDIERISNPLRFQGQYADDETGLHYNRYRYYDNRVGAYVSQDPIRLLGSINTYTYGQNPIGWVDPWGLILKEVADAMPNSAGVYHIELGDEYYTGSGVDIHERLSNSKHPALRLLNDPDVVVTTYPVDLGTAAGNNRMSNHILRGYEQGIMTVENNVPKTGGSLNQVRAAAKTRVGEFAQDAVRHGASRGGGTISTPSSRAAGTMDARANC